MARKNPNAPVNARTTRMIKVYFLNGDGSGWADPHEVADGTTVGQIFSSKMGARSKAEDFQIRVNREIVSAHDILEDGDTVSITPRKIEGA